MVPRVAVDSQEKEVLQELMDVKGTLEFPGQLVYKAHKELEDHLELVHTVP